MQLVMITLFSNIVELPLRVAFAEQMYYDGALTAARWVELLSDLALLFDVGLHFLRAYIDVNGDVVTSHRQIALHYSRTWLVPDALGSFPLDWCVADSFDELSDGRGGSSRALKMLRLSKVVLRFMLVLVHGASKRRAESFATANPNTWAIAKVMQGLEALFSPPALLVLRHLAIFLMMAHCLACVQFFLAQLVAAPACGEPSPSSSWAYKAELLPCTLNDATGDAPSAILLTSHAGVFYIASVFHVTMQLLGVGYGLGGSPGPWHEHLLLIVAALLGAYWVSYAMALMAMSVSESTANRREYRLRISKVHQFAQTARLPRELLLKLLLYYEIAYPEGRIHHEETILHEISEPLRVAIAKHRYENMLSKLKRYMTEDGLEDAMIARLEHSIFVQDDVVIAQGQRNTMGMYFITDGDLDVVLKLPSGMEICVASLCAGELFGEASLIDQTSRAKATVRVRNFCEGFVLSPEAFFQICHDFPSFHASVEALSQRRQMQNQEEAHIAESSRMEGGCEDDGRDEESSANERRNSHTDERRHSSVKRHPSGIEGKNRRMLACSRSLMAAQLHRDSTTGSRASRQSTTGSRSRMSGSSCNSWMPSLKRGSSSNTATSELEA
jgi:CRP-like cAMP-binding protein